MIIKVSDHSEMRHCGEEVTNELRRKEKIEDIKRCFESFSNIFHQLNFESPYSRRKQHQQHNVRNLLESKEQLHLNRDYKHLYEERIERWTNKYWNEIDLHKDAYNSDWIELQAFQQICIDTFLPNILETMDFGCFLMESNFENNHRILFHRQMIDFRCFFVFKGKRNILPEIK